MRRVLIGMIVGLPLAIGTQAALAFPSRAPQPVAPPLAVTPVEFWCSPGFEPRGGRCIATLSRDELFIYETDAYAEPRVRRRSPRRGLRELY